MTQTLALSIGLPVAYILIGALVSRCIYTYGHNHNGVMECNDQAPAAFVGFVFWPLAGLIFGVIWFVTNGVRKQNKTSGRAS